MPRRPVLSSFALALLLGCGEQAPSLPPPSGEPPVDLPPPLDPLPPPAHATSDQLATSDVCAQCHAAQQDHPAMRDEAGRDVSPVNLWRGSMMALAARDPYYLAVFSEELTRHPESAGLINRTCVRCHAPAGSVEAGPKLDFEGLTQGTDVAHRLGRDGVTCSLCHQIADKSLGQASSFTGGFEIGYDRLIFGPHASPHAEPMQLVANYTPTYSAHITGSEVCATCHTVIVDALDERGLPKGPTVIEQAPYLEWLSSDHGRGGKGCIACHLPTHDEDGQPIVTQIAALTGPLAANLSPREPYGRHVLVGGNAYMLRLLADNEDWARHDLPSGELEQAALRSESHLAGAAELAIVRAELMGDQLDVEVRVTNLTGHKLPTGYPTRRVWLHLEVLDADGDVLFASGAFDEQGALVGDGARLDPRGRILPHVDLITRADQVIVYEGVLVDPSGAPTHLALGAEGYAKDNRILPAGFESSSSWPIDPVGVDGDPSFVPGSDAVRYRVAVARPPRQVNATLLYQSIPPAAIEATAAVPTPAAVRFHQMASSSPPSPVPIATTSRSL